MILYILTFIEKLSLNFTGASIKDEDFQHEARYLATKEFDVEGGGVVTYYVKYNDPEKPGGQQCVDKVDAMLKVRGKEVFFLFLAQYTQYTVVANSLYARC